MHTTSHALDVHRFGGSAVRNRGWRSRELLQHIAEQQLTDGTFASLELDLAAASARSVPDGFATALIVWLTSDLSPASAPWREKTLDRLESAQDSRGLWSFRGPGGAYPPDLDDTSVAALALRLADRLDRQSVADRIYRFPRHTSGLLQTWADGGDRAQSVDLTANMHALLALRTAGVDDGELESALSSRQSSAAFLRDSPYYRYGSALPFLFAALCLARGSRDMLSGLMCALQRTATERQLVMLAGGKPSVIRDANEASAYMAAVLRFNSFAPIYHRRHAPTMFAADALHGAYLLAIRRKFDIA